MYFRLASSVLQAPSAFGAGGALLLAFMGRVTIGIATPMRADEAFSWRVLEYSLEESLFRVAADGIAPGHQIVLTAWASLFGESLLSLRCLSVLCSLLSFWLISPIVGSLSTDQRSPGGLRKGGVSPFWALMLYALCPLQVTEASVARMYSLGVCLCLASTLLLISATGRSLRQDQSYGKWLLYGIAMATFAYVHHFAFFTAASHAIIIGVLIAQQRSAAMMLLRGCMLAAGIALTLYSPWLPVLFLQAEQAQAGFWIPPVTESGTTRMITYWLIGIPVDSLLVGICVLGAVVCLVLVCARNHGRWILYLGIPAVVPLVLCICVSLTWGQSLLLERYLSFCQVSGIVLAGLCISTIAGRGRRFFAGAPLICASVTGLWVDGAWSMQHDRELVAAIQTVRNGIERDDLVVVDGYSTLNRVLYYMGNRSLDVRCRVGRQKPLGHTHHIASLDDDNRWDSKHQRPVRLWTISSSRGVQVPAVYECIWRDAFGEGRNAWRVQLFARRPSGPSK